MTYELKYEPVTIGGVLKPKYNIYYTGGPFDGCGEFHSVDGINGIIRYGYVNINRTKWAEMLNAMLQSGAILTKMRTATNMAANLACVFGVLQSGANGFPDQANLQALMRLAGWGFTAQEKTTINNYFANNNFTITVV